MKNLRGIFELLWRIILSTFKYIIILGIIITGLLLYFTNKQNSAGKDWCEEMIISYENDKSKFLKEHRQNTKDGMEFFPPKSLSKNVNADFTLHVNGDYRCKYRYGGVTRPHSYAYDSKTKLWSELD